MQRALQRLQSDSTRNFKAIEQSATGMGQKMDSAFGVAAAGLASFGKGLIGTALAALSFDQMIGRSVVSLAKLGDQAQRLGVTTDAIQAMRFELAQNGAEADDADKALDRFADKLGDAARGQGELHKWFEANNIAIKNQAGELRSVEEMLEVTARLMAGLSTQQEKVNFAVDVFGKQAGPRMIGMLERIAADGFGVVVQQAKDIGVVVDKELVQKAQVIEDAWDKMATQMAVALKSKVITAIEETGSALSAMDKMIVDFYSRLPGGKKLVEAASSQDTFADRWSAMGSPLKKFEPPGAPKNRTTAPAAEEKEAAKAREGYFQREQRQTQERIASMKLEIEMLGKSTFEIEKAKKALELEQNAKREGIPLNEANRATIEQLATAYGKVAQALEDAKNPLANFAREAANTKKQLQDVALKSINSLEDALVSVATGAETVQEAFKKMANAIIADLIRMAIRSAITGPLAGMMGGGGLPLPGRAGGGPVQAGRPYQVGERGRELFVPNVAGRIVPNHKLARSGGSMNLSFPTTINADRDTDVNGIQRVLAQRDADIIRQVRRSLPGMMNSMQVQGV